MVWELLVGFAVLVAASYLGTTMALNRFFGPEGQGIVDVRADGGRRENDRTGDDGIGGRTVGDGTGDGGAGSDGDDG